MLSAALITAVVTIPLSNNLNSIATIVFVAACLVQEPWSVMKERLARNKFWLIPVIFFLWYCCTWFWDVSGGFTNKEIERYTILLFLPAACAVTPRISNSLLRQACFAFIAVTVLLCLIALAKSYSEYNQAGDYRVFFYQYLGEQVGLNAIFLSNFCLASITWILYYGYVQRRNRKTIDHVTSIALAGFLMLMLFLLSSKIVLFLTFIIIVVFVLALGYLRGYFLGSLLVVGLILAAGAVAVTNLHYLSWRIKSTEFKKYSGPEDDNNGIAIRLFMWETSYDLIRERPFTGYGIKGARETLLSEYERKNFTLGVQGYYHSHNQYIESTLMAGIPALLILLWMIGAAFRRAITSGNFLLLLMLSHFVIQSMFEATFEVQHELVFYLFFIFLFYYHAPVTRSDK